MISVTLHNPERGEAWLVLTGESGQQGLPIFVGSNLQILISELWRKTPRPLKNPRPLTFSFSASVLECQRQPRSAQRTQRGVAATKRASAVSGQRSAGRGEGLGEMEEGRRMW